ncbi:RHS repeat-associated core domain-containing protein [Streptomyces rectiviolaceus]|uniref:RHS repeat-associated core domain-containing protein n=1 Tax=Streptomyces rectiviolaceus TaxID=332591 RepID=A0ABP6NR27_9ACTN
MRLPNEARFYDPNVGRFTQPDPSGLETNPYLYASGDPTNRIDPSGLFSVGNFLQGVGSGLVAVAAGAAAVTTAPACVTVVGCIPTVAEAGIALGAAGASYEFFKEAF